jgi:hypothetical protein
VLAATEIIKAPSISILLDAERFLFTFNRKPGGSVDRGKAVYSTYTLR